MCIYIYLFQLCWDSYWVYKFTILPQYDYRHRAYLYTVFIDYTCIEIVTEHMS